MQSLAPSYNVAYSGLALYSLYTQFLNSMVNPVEFNDTVNTDSDIFKLGIILGCSKESPVAAFDYEHGDLGVLYHREKDNAVVLITKSSSNSVWINVRIVVDKKFSGIEETKIIFERLKKSVHVPPQSPNTTVDLRFWYHTNNGPEWNERNIEVPQWSNIRQNYAGSAVKELDSLMSLDLSDSNVSGKLILMHGAPGTGKTTAIRSLANSWKGWCSSEYIVDPEEAFGRANYLVNVLLSRNIKKHRLIIIEDAEEFLVPQTKISMGQSVARLLNIGDGLLGQGIKLLILLTTNEPIAKLHPAITRPGRCLANIEIPALSSEEATKWLGQKHESATLAELFEAKEKSQLNNVVDEQHGVYL